MRGGAHSCWGSRNATQDAFPRRRGSHAFDRGLCGLHGGDTTEVVGYARAEIHSPGEGEQGWLEEEAKEKVAEDVRIQRNALKMLDPEPAKDLTLRVREEVYRLLERI
jgi:hypothetical protein